MKMNNKFSGKLAMISVAGLLSCATVFAAPHDWNHDGKREWRNDRISIQGHVREVHREGDRFRVVLDRGNYTYWVPVATVGARDLRIGADVRFNGLVQNDGVVVDMFALNGEPSYTVDPNYRAVPYGSSGWMTGTVQRVDRRLNYLALRDDQSGAVVKIDVRHMNRHQPVNVWNVKPGDRVTVNGSWEKRDTFDAMRIEY